MEITLTLTEEEAQLVKRAILNQADTFYLRQTAERPDFAIKSNILLAVAKRLPEVK